MQFQTIDKLIDAHGLAYFCEMFGWQGGTRAQVISECRKRWAADGIVIDKNGQIGQMTLDGQPLVCAVTL